MAEKQAKEEGHVLADQNCPDPQPLTGPYPPLQPSYNPPVLSPRMSQPGSSQSPQPPQQYMQPPYSTAPARPPIYSGSVQPLSFPPLPYQQPHPHRQPLPYQPYQQPQPYRQPQPYQPQPYRPQPYQQQPYLQQPNQYYQQQPYQHHQQQTYPSQPYRQPQPYQQQHNQLPHQQQPHPPPPQLGSNNVSKPAEEKEVQDKKQELPENISLNGWLLKKGVRGPTGRIWRSRYFRLQEGNKLAYYKTAEEDIPQGLAPQGFIDIDKITTVLIPPAAQQDTNNGTFHLVTPTRTYELQAIDESAMKWWISIIQNVMEWRDNQKRKAQQ